MPKEKRRMTAPEFEALLPWLTDRISVERIAAARAVLVDNKKYQEAGDVYGWKRQSVNDAVGVVWETYQRYRQSQQTSAAGAAELPPGWEQITLIAPSALLAKFRAEIAALNEIPAVAPAKRTRAKKDKPE